MGRPVDRLGAAGAEAQLTSPGTRRDARRQRCRGAPPSRGSRHAQQHEEEGGCEQGRGLGERAPSPCWKRNRRPAERQSVRDATRPCGQLRPRRHAQCVAVFERMAPELLAAGEADATARAGEGHGRPREHFFRSLFEKTGMTKRVRLQCLGVREGGAAARTHEGELRPPHRATLSERLISSVLDLASLLAAGRPSAGRPPAFRSARSRAGRHGDGTTAKLRVAVIVLFLELLSELGPSSHVTTL
jgi:hypothetical protein